MIYLFDGASKTTKAIEGATEKALLTIKALFWGEKNTFSTIK